VPLIQLVQSEDLLQSDGASFGLGGLEQDGSEGSVAEGFDLGLSEATSDYDDLVDGGANLRSVRVARDGLFEVLSVEGLSILNAGLTFDDGDDVTVCIDLSNVDATDSDDVLVAEVGATSRIGGLPSVLLSHCQTRHPVSFSTTFVRSASELDSRANFVSCIAVFVDGVDNELKELGYVSGSRLDVELDRTDRVLFVPVDGARKREKVGATVDQSLLQRSRN